MCPPLHVTRNIKNIQSVKILTIDETDLVDEAWEDSPIEPTDNEYQKLVSQVKDSFYHSKPSIPESNEILLMLTELEIDHANLGRIILQANDIFGSLREKFEDYLMLQ